MLPNVHKYIMDTQVVPVPAERKLILQQLVHYITSQRQAGVSPQLHFICTHNSRRSQLSQVWAQIAAHYHGVTVQCYSGGVEVTACHPYTIEALQAAGMAVLARGELNPTYLVQYAPDTSPVVLYSKVYDAPLQPVDQFAAVMTCAHADENCPHIVGAAARLPVRYDDPKVSDGTAERVAVYSARNQQIASEMLYVFEAVASST